MSDTDAVIQAPEIDPTTIPGGAGPRKKPRRSRGPRDPSKSPKLYFHSGTQYKLITQATVPGLME
jgi:hypothetical protein